MSIDRAAKSASNPMDLGPCSDLIVIVPGILGTCLGRRQPDGSVDEVWGGYLRRIVANLLTLGSKVYELAIEPGMDPSAPDDGVVPMGLLPDQMLIAGFAGVAGYTRTINRMTEELGLVDRQVCSFPYDWRLPCEVNGRLLSLFLDREVQSWRKRSGRPDARASLVAHSMGGLVSRWAVEVEGAHELVSNTITLGTPFKGAAKALDVLANGLKHGQRLGEFLRTLPSVHQLLPTYECVLTGNDRRLRSLSEVDILPSAWVASAQDLYGTIDTSAERRADGRNDRLICFRGSKQKTTTTAAFDSGGVLRMFDTIDATPRGPRQDGDGTVPFGSAFPPEWSTRTWAQVTDVTERHSYMQAADPVIGLMAKVFDHRPGDRSISEPIGLTLDDAVRAGASFVVEIDGHGHERLGLVATAMLVDSVGPPEVLDIVRSGDTYTAHCDGLPPGVYEVTVARSGRNTAPVDPVSELLLVYTDD